MHAVDPQILGATVKKENVSRPGDVVAPNFTLLLIDILQQNRKFDFS
jgi:hypothetical protein